MHYHDPRPKRRRFAYSLRTLFLVVTVGTFLSAWVAYQLKWIRERHALLGEQNVAVSFTPSRRAPSLLWLLGERGANKIFLQYDGYLGRPLPKAQKSRASRLFPEAEIKAWGGTVQPADHPGTRFE